MWPCGRTLVQHMYFCQPAVVFCPRVSRGATMGWAVTSALVWRQGGRTEHVTRGKFTCFPKRKVSAGCTFGEEEVRSDAGETEGGVLQKYKRKLRYVLLIRRRKVFARRSLPDRT